MTRRWILALALAWAPMALAAPIDKSDLVPDGIIDDRDVEVFANQYLRQEVQSVDWCNFYASSLLNEKYFRRVVKDSVQYYKTLLDYVATTNQCASLTTTSDKLTTTNDKSDLDLDGDVDLDDLDIFSANYLGRSWQTVDWCVFHGSTLAGADFEGQSTKYYQRFFTSLLAFINDYFACNAPEPPPNSFALEDVPRYLTRIADATAFNGKYYVSDPRVGSVFIYDELMVLSGELKGLNRPLGVAVDALGRILVGNDGRDNVEVFDSTTGELLAVFGQGIVQMPTAITFDDVGNIYVVDSKLDRVHVFDATFNLVRSIGRSGIGNGTLDFPMDAEIITTTTAQEIFIADQGSYSVQVFGLDGTWRRGFGFGGTPGQNCNWWTGQCAVPGVPPFKALQALSTDTQGHLHVLDNFAATVTMFDPANGAFLGAYGAYGTASGQLRVPMDVSVSASDLAIVTTGDGGRVEIFGVPQ